LFFYQWLLNVVNFLFFSCSYVNASLHSNEIIKKNEERFYKVKTCVFHMNFMNILIFEIMISQGMTITCGKKFGTPLIRMFQEILRTS